MRVPSASDIPEACVSADAPSEADEGGGPRGGGGEGGGGRCSPLLGPHEAAGSPGVGRARRAYAPQHTAATRGVLVPHARLRRLPRAAAESERTTARMQRPPLAIRNRRGCPEVSARRRHIFPCRRGLAVPDAGRARAASGGDDTAVLNSGRPLHVAATAQQWRRPVAGASRAAARGCMVCLFARQRRPIDAARAAGSGRE
jgi:hypothetical protein